MDEFEWISWLMNIVTCDCCICCFRILNYASQYWANQISLLLSTFIYHQRSEAHCNKKKLLLFSHKNNLHIWLQCPKLYQTGLKVKWTTSVSGNNKSDSTTCKHQSSIHPSMLRTLQTNTQSDWAVLPKTGDFTHFPFVQKHPQ